MLVRSSSSPRILENDVASQPDVRPSFRSQLKSPYSGLLLYVPRAESPGPGKHGDKAKAQGPFCLCLWPVGAHLVNGHRDRLRMSYGHRNQPTSLCTASSGHPLDRTVVHRPGTHSSPSGCYHDRTAMAHDADPSLSQHTLTYGLFHNNIFVGCRKARRCHCTHSSSSEGFFSGGLEAMFRVRTQVSVGLLWGATGARCRFSLHFHGIAEGTGSVGIVMSKRRVMATSLS